MKLLQIGVGGFGLHWVRQLVQEPAVELVGLIDVNEQALTEAGKLAKLPKKRRFKTLEAAIDALEADGLICVSPPAFHLQHINTAVDAGLDVICEKPLATTLADAVGILQAARRSGRTVAVAQNYRHRPVTYTMRNLVQSDAIGEIGQVRLDFYKGWPFSLSDFRRTMPFPILVDMSIHHFDLLRYITGLEAQTVRGEAWNPAWSLNEGDTSAAIRFTMENGATVLYNASWCAQGDFCDWNGDWLVEGERGAIRYTGGTLSLNHTDRRHQVTTALTITPESPLHTEQRAVLADFMAARREGRRPLTDVRDNLRSISMVFTAVDAVKTGQTLPVLDDELATLLVEAAPAA